MRVYGLLIFVFLVILGVGFGVKALFASGTHEGAIYTRNGVAIDGYDPVAYFTLGQAVPGDPAYQYQWAEATWQFSSREHRELFAADPERYAPAYGGYCAWAASENSIAGINPQAWHIEGERLFLNYNHRLNRRFTDDVSDRVQRADAHWPALERELVTP